MKNPAMTRSRLLSSCAALGLAFGLNFGSNRSVASGEKSTPQVDIIKVRKCYYDAPTGSMMIQASSSDSTVRLYALRPSGDLLGEVQNGRGSRDGGTVMGYVATDPVQVAIFSTSGGSVIVPTLPFQG